MQRPEVDRSCVSYVSCVTFAALRTLRALRYMETALNFSKTTEM